MLFKFESVGQRGIMSKKGGSRLIKTIRRELKDRTYPLIHVDPDYTSLTPNGDGTYEKKNDQLPFLERKLTYETLGQAAKYKKFYVPSAAEENPYRALEFSISGLQGARLFLLYDTTDTDTKTKLSNLALHPIAIYKSYDNTPPSFSGKYLVANNNGTYMKFESTEMDSKMKNLLPDGFKENTLYQRHFMLAGAGTANPNDNFKQKEIEVTEHYFVYDKVAYSVALNLSSSRTIDESVANGVSFTSSAIAPKYNEFYQRVMESASRQCAVFNGYLLECLFKEDGSDAFEQLRQIAQNTADDYYASRHVLLVWTALLAYYLQIFRPMINSEYDSVRTRQKITQSIVGNKLWKQSTSVDFDLSADEFPRLALEMLKVVTATGTKPAKLDEYRQIANNALNQQLKITIDSSVFKLDSLMTDDSDEQMSEKTLADEFKLQADNYKKIWIALQKEGEYVAPQRADSNASSTSPQAFADKIVQYPFYPGAYATEIDRVAGAIATGEVECVPAYEKGRSDKYMCDHGVSLSEVPNSKQQSHPHPVAEYFNEGVVVIAVELLRSGHSLQSVPYFQKIKSNNGYPWPLRPAIEIQFQSGRKSYVPADILWLKYSETTNKKVAKLSSATDKISVYFHRLLKRATVLKYLPSIVIVTLDKKNQIRCDRSHSELIPPTVIVAISQKNQLVRATSTLYHNGFIFNEGDGAEADKQLDLFVRSQFEGLMPELWTYRKVQSQGLATQAAIAERMCLGLSPQDAERVTQEATDAADHFLKHELFGIPNLKKKTKTSVK